MVEFYLEDVYSLNPFVNQVFSGSPDNRIQETNSRLWSQSLRKSGLFRQGIAQDIINSRAVARSQSLRKSGLFRLQKHNCLLGMLHQGSLNPFVNQVFSGHQVTGYKKQTAEFVSIPS